MAFTEIRFTLKCEGSFVVLRGVKLVNQQVRGGSSAVVKLFQDFEVMAKLHGVAHLIIISDQLLILFLAVVFLTDTIFVTLFVTNLFLAVF